MTSRKKYSLLNLDITRSKTSWIPVTFEMEEGLSTLFKIKITAYSTYLPSTAEQLLAGSATVTLNSTDQKPRYFNGRVSKITPKEILNRNGIYRYDIILEPWLAFLDLDQDNKIFKKLTVPDIIRDVLQAYPYVSLNRRGLISDYPKLAYTVQYQESRFHFISRLMEEAGISYYFQHTENSHTLCLIDDPAYYQTYTEGAIPFEGSSHYRCYMEKWGQEYRSVPTEFQVQDYDFKNPDACILGKAGTPHPFILPVMDFSVRGQTQKEADQRAKINWQRAQNEAEKVIAAGNCSALAAGMTFDLKDHPRDDANGRYLVTKMRHLAVDSTYWDDLQTEIHTELNFTTTMYRNELKAIPAKQYFRPKLLRERPIIHGHHLAKVVSNTETSIDVDEYGQVTVVFSWDQYQTTSSRMRVMQPWAGNGMGAQFIPRAGDEVMVKYINGDIDQPIIVGSLVNGDNPPMSTLPDQQTTSGIKTQSLRTDDHAMHNALNFVDSRGHEAINLIAQKDLTMDVNNNFTVDIGNGQYLTVGGDMTMTVSGDISQAAESLTFTVGASSMTINTKGVFFKAPKVTILSSGGGAIQSAARLGDTHQCPQMYHDQGIIHTASANVLINGVGAARYGDPIHCQNNSTDTINQGVPGIYINGQPAATRNHQTKHQGVIQSGSGNVMLGGISSVAGEATTTTVNQQWIKGHHGKYLGKNKRHVDFDRLNTSSPLVAQTMQNPTVKSDNYNFYFVNSLIKYQITSSVSDELSRVIANFNITDYFQEEDWLESNTEEGAADNEEKSNSGLSSSSAVKAAASGAAAATINIAYESGVNYDLISRLQTLMPQIKASMPANGGVLIKGVFDVYDAESVRINIVSMFVYKSGLDYMPLIKESFEDSIAVELPPKGYEREYLFIWATRN